MNGYKTIIAHIPEESHKRLKLKLVREGISIKDWVEKQVLRELSISE